MISEILAGSFLLVPILYFFGSDRIRTICRLIANATLTTAKLYRIFIFWVAVDSVSVSYECIWMGSKTPSGFPSVSSDSIEHNIRLSLLTATNWLNHRMQFFRLCIHWLCNPNGQNTCMWDKSSKSSTSSSQQQRRRWKNCQSHFILYLQNILRSRTTSLGRSSCSPPLSLQFYICMSS